MLAKYHCPVMHSFGLSSKRLTALLAIEQFHSLEEVQGF